ncbi:MAG TPA: aminotransferase class I/II-fold pyridoxal phosphate-dependent enzyme, partial [Desulfobacteria bacterium]|nr:aminotransferase class I/II-fold pyridoxal phosphate-dependent enzyme [Desulfobacteria bacterium]
RANIEAVFKYGTGSGSSPILAGTLDVHRELEQKLAEFKSCEDAMVFPSGFQTNYSLINGLLRSQDAVINDILNHASIVEGCKGAQAKFGTRVDFYVHNNMKSLRKKLELASNKCNGGKLVITDGVFSMDGDIAPLPEICTLAREYGAKVVVDEAHSTGILGKTGRGTCEHYSMKGQVDLIVGTFSKTFGAVGGFIAGKRKVIEYLRMYGPGYMFSTASAPGISAAVLKCLEIIEKDSSFRNQLWENTLYMQKELKSLGYDINGSQTPIIPVNVPHDKAFPLTLDLQKRNIFINPVIYPAVSKNRARLRISLMSTHTREELDQSLYALEGVGRKHGVI